MDYVVFGIGFGATILVLGLLLRDFGPRLRFRRSRDGEDVLSAEELVGKVSWTRFCNALGSVLALAGAVFLLITLVAMILVVSDDTGLWIMSVAFAALIVIIAYWTWAYFHRFGSYGILPERSEPEPAPAFVASRDEPQEEPAFDGPPMPLAADDPADHAVGDVEPTTSEGEATEIAGDNAPGEPDASPVETPDAAVADDDEHAPSPRMETPEERLAHAESPIDHGSAEGDLDLAASRPRRPGALAPKRSEPAEAPGAESENVSPADDRDRA